MPVLPALRDLFRAITTPGSHDNAPVMSVAAARALTHARMEQFILAYYGPAEPLADEADHLIPVAEGCITVRIYAPSGAGARLPCHVYFHGGGFWLGTLTHFDPLCRALARDAGCVVASVDYRLAPEHKYPTAAEDGYAALRWLVEHARELGIDPSRLSVGGVSAGGNLAAAVALMARDRGSPPLVLQILEVPVTDLSSDEPLRIPEEGVELPSGKDVYREYYLADPAEALLPYVSPLLAPDLAGLPPAIVMCAEYDPLAAEGEAYAGRLAQAQVAVEHHCWQGQFHGAQPMAVLIPEEAAAYHATIVAALRKAHAST